MRKSLPAAVFFLAFLGLVFQAHPGRAEETEIPGVTAGIDYIRQYNGTLHPGIRLKNGNEKVASTGKQLQFSKIVIADAKAGKKYSPMKGADGRAKNRRVEIVIKKVAP